MLCSNLPQSKVTLKNAVASLDERSIWRGVTVKDTITNPVLFSVLNAYGIAQTAERLPFLEELLASSLLQSMSKDLPCFWDTLTSR